MTLDQIKAIAAKRTKGEWLKRFDSDYYQAGEYLGVGPLKYIPDTEHGGNKKTPCSPDEVEYFEQEICRIESGDNDREFIAMAANNIDKLIAVVEALKGLQVDNCFCEVRIGNPNMRGIHSDNCKAATEALAALEQE